MAKKDKKEKTKVPPAVSAYLSEIGKSVVKLEAKLQRN